MKTYVFEIDGTICSNTNGDYEKAIPYKERIKFINKLFDEGNFIKYLTTRNSLNDTDLYQKTEHQLNKWGAKYNELILNKPEGDFYINGKAFNSNYWIFPNNKLKNNFDDSTSEFIFKKPIYDHLETINKVLNDKNLIEGLQNLCTKVGESFSRGGKIIFAGNGGSFADAQHLAAEFVCKFSTDRIPLPALALGTNSSTLTAIGNDFGYQFVFSREIEAIANKNDLIIALSTSGNSPNIIELIEKVKEIGLPYFVLTGKSGGKFENSGNSIIKVPSNNTAVIQQLHIIIGHIICTNTELPFI